MRMRISYTLRATSARVRKRSSPLHPASLRLERRLNLCSRLELACKVSTMGPVAARFAPPGDICVWCCRVDSPMRCACVFFMYDSSGTLHSLVESASYNPFLPDYR